MCDFILENALLRGERVDVAVKGGLFTAVEPAGILRPLPAKERLDGTGFLLRPPFYNTHTHQPMTLLRGIDDNCTLMDWLQQVIWPLEKRLTPDDIHAGTRLAILEGIHSGCVAFNDMYCGQTAVVRAAREMGVRARIGVVVQSEGSSIFENDALLAMRDTLPPEIGISFAPHALYTTTPEILRAMAAQARDLDLPIHTHAAESLSECACAKEDFGFDSPIAYLDACGVLTPKTILAHCCHLSAADWDLLAGRGVTVAHCPESNRKLASGTFSWSAARQAGVRVTVGTDGAASNNGLSMIAETKSAALTAKLAAGRPDALPFAELDRAVTQDAADALGFAGCGQIKPGAPADFILVNLNRSVFAGGGDADANFIYAGDSSCVDTVVCAGRFLMRGGIVPGEETILETARAAAARLRAAG